jgi:uncharacterized protein (DUF1330 family)
VMLNLLRFKERADGAGEGSSGEEAYLRYAARMREIVERAGGRFLFAGRADSQFLGRSDVSFHAIGLVEYPSRQAFLNLVTSPEVQEIGAYRSAGLEGQWLIAATQTT